MADAGLIARVYPYSDEFGLARRAIESSHYVPPRAQQQQPQDAPQSPQSHSSRESTLPPEDSDQLDTLPYLELRFDQVPRSPLGLVFGTDTTISDIVLPKNVSCTSRRHFALTYRNDFEDGLYRLVVRDLGSTYGTVVTYDGKGDEPRNKFDWIIDGFDLPSRADKIIIQPNQNIKFRIVVTRHDITSPVYINNVERFRQGAANPTTLLIGLGLQSGPTTQGNSQAHSPVKDKILLERGGVVTGRFGTVSRYWNVSTGEEYACKKPVNKDYNKEAWKNEIDLMQEVDHDHIVRLCFWRETPLPSLFLEYMTFGNLADEHRRHHFSDDECVVILRQSLSALVYLHGRPDPITHRDIKPQNILVKHRDRNYSADSLHIKLSDFGLSKAGSLKTYCGSHTYLPPEVRDDDSQYTMAVDIWSLGVVVFKFAYGLPSRGSRVGMEWCQKVVEETRSQESGDLVDILQHMVVIEAEARYSAAACLREVSQLHISSEDRSATPTPASCAAGLGKTIVHVPPRAQGGASLESQPSSDSWTTNSEQKQYNNCWLDPLHSLGGGPSITQLIERKSTPQNLSEHVDEGSEDSRLPDWPPQSNKATEKGPSQNVTDPSRHPADGGKITQCDSSQGDSSQGNPSQGDSSQGWGNKWTESEKLMAVALLQEIEGSSARSDASSHRAPSNHDAFGGGGPVDGYHAGSPVHQKPNPTVEHENLEPSPGVTEARPVIFLPPCVPGEQPDGGRKTTSHEDKPILKSASLRGPGPNKPGRLNIANGGSTAMMHVRTGFVNRRCRNLQAARSHPYLPRPPARGRDDQNNA